MKKLSLSRWAIWLLTGSGLRVFFLACGKLIILVSFWSQVHIFIMFYFPVIIALKRPCLTFQSRYPLCMEFVMLFNA